MEKVEYKGKIYEEVEKGSQEALHELGIHSFRYYPQEGIMVNSGMMASEFGLPKVIEGMPQSLADILIHEDDWGTLFEMHKKLMSGTRKVSAELRTKNGRLSRVTVSALKQDERGLVMSAVGLVEDLAEDMRQYNVMMALSSNYLSVYYVDLTSNKIYPYRLAEAIDREYGEFFRSKPSYEMAITAYIMNTVHPEERQEMLMMSSMSFLKEQLKDKEAFTHVFRALHDGELMYARMKVVNVSKGDEMTAMVFGFADVTREKKRDIEKYAYVDSVTGGDNHNRFKEDLLEAHRSGFLVSMDIHSFKIVNVACGTARGDETLRNVWQCICDVTGTLDLAGHINADHFAIFLNTEDESHVVDVLEKLTARMEELSAQMDIPILTPYFGVARYDEHKGHELCFGEANTAKHEAKELNDVNYAFYSEASSERLIMEKQMEDDFAPSIEEKRFEVWYQAKYDAKTRKLVGAEALSRWRKSDGSLVSPGLFIPLFEKNGKIRELDEYVFRAVCMTQKAWQEEGRELFPISVNLSRASMYYQNVVEQYRSIAHEIGIDPKYVPIEVTESAAISNNEIHSFVEDFHNAGFPLHLDDFGTGYSSLASLNVLHFDTLKLDKSLIDYIGNNSGDKLLKHTIALAKDVGMHVIAEGVEQEEQVQFLANQNCDSIQGFYFAKPVPIQEFRSMI